MKLPGKEENALLLALEIVLAGIVIILLLLISCLFAPLAYEFDLTGVEHSLQFHLGFHNFCCGVSASRTDGEPDWNLLILGKHIVLKQKRTSPESHESTDSHKLHKAYKSPESSSRSSRGRTRLSSSRFLLRKVVSDAGLRAQILNLIITVWQNIKPNHVTVIARIGFSEPHYTSWMMALAAMLQTNNNDYTIHIEGVWDEPCLEGELGLTGKVIPGMILWYILKFALHREVRPYYRKLRAQTVISRKQAA